jgi:hypothetical protein
MAFSAPAKKKEKDDYVALRISVRVSGQFTGNSKEVTDDGSVIRTFKDAYTTSYTSVTKWKVIDLDQGDDIAALERVSDKPDVSGSGQGSMTGVSKHKVYGPMVKGKRKESWQTETATSNWTYKFPQDSKPFPAQVRLHKRAKTFRIELNAVGPEMPDVVGNTIMTFKGPEINETRTLDSPISATIGSAMATMSQTAAIPLDKSEKRLTGKFDPEKPFAVSGTAVFNASEVPSFKMIIDGLAQSLGQGGSINGDGKLYVSYTLAWNCEPTEIDAIIVPKGYESWLPKASTSGSNPGNNIDFEVKIIDKKTGEEPEDKTAYFQCDLSDVTKEPGSCMNSTSKATEPDLKFLKSDNPEMETIPSNGQTATSKKELKSCNVSVSCYDGAAYGRLKVEAHLDDGRVVLAHVEGKSGGMDVTIPYDDNDNKIADTWEDSKGVKGKSPSVDDDEQPLGDHDNGDGLTIWEEYRGFMEDGKYIRTDPKKKDLFICDTIGGKCKRAINRFAALTKLDVHDKLTVEELDASRIINRNRSADAPHVVDQHGIIIETWGTKGTCMAAGGPGTPKSITQVLIDSTLSETVTKKLGGGKTKTYEYYEPTVAHEILHCCNVWHHGQVDEEYCWQAETVGGSTNIYEYASEADCGHPERGTKIKAFLETPVNRIYVATDPYWSTPTSVWLGKDQGQHSGNEDCVMRYDCSTAYTKDASGRYCLLMDFGEPVGQGLCTSPTGTGVNAAGRVPASRYGDAAADKGDCVDKFCVNDLYH